MIPSLLLVGSISGEQAVALAKRTLADFEVSGPIRLQSLGGSYQLQTSSGLRPSGDLARWHLKLSTPLFTYRVALTEEGRPLSIERSELKGNHNFMRLSQDAAKTARWLQRLHPRLPVRLVPSNRVGDSVFVYEALVGGYPVVYPRDGLGYVFMLQKGALLRFSAQENPPPLGSPIPRLNEADALAAVDRAFRAQNPPRDGWTFSYHLYDRRELGWAVPDGGGPARLAWRMPFMFQRSGSFGTQGGSSGMLIDAVTGKPIRTKNVP